MDDEKTEILYLQRRVSDSLAMAAAATGPCARTAHMELARLYGDAIDRLVAKRVCLTFGAPLPPVAVQHAVSSIVPPSRPMPVPGGSALPQRRSAAGPSL